MMNPMFTQGTMYPGPWMAGQGFGFPYAPWAPQMGFGFGQYAPPAGFGFGQYAPPTGFGYGQYAPPAGFGYGQGMPTPGYYPGGYGPGYYTESWPSDDQIRDMIYDSIDADPVIPYDTDVNVEVTGGVVTLTGTVPSKRIKHAIGDDAWWVPGVWDVNNNIQVVLRRKVREVEGARPTAPTGAPRPTGAAKATTATTKKTK